MVVSYNKKDMIAFAKYCLSKEREEMVTNHHHELRITQDFKTDLESSLRGVSHADFCNWLEKEGKTLYA